MRDLQILTITLTILVESVDFNVMCSRSVQASQRGKPAVVSTEADPNDPLHEQYGDSLLVQSKGQTDRKFMYISDLSESLKGQEVICKTSL